GQSGTRRGVTCRGCRHRLASITTAQPLGRQRFAQRGPHRFIHLKDARSTRPATMICKEVFCFASEGASPMDEFLALSSLLTGLPSLKKVDPLSVESRMARDYLRLMKEQFGPGFDALLAIYRRVAADPDPLLALLQDPGFATEPVDTAA